MELEYDEDKRLWTLDERDLDFARATEVFDSFHFTVEDRHGRAERRYQTIGLYEERVVLVVWTPRPPNRRIISMRDCEDDEAEIYQRRARSRPRRRPRLD